MTTELEEQFFKAFEIEPKWKDKRVKNSKTYYTKEQADYLRATTKNRNIQLCYPEITDRKLLEMICILGTAIRHFKTPPKLKLEQLKYHILRNCINEQEGIYTRIQQLFKEEE